MQSVTYTISPSGKVEIVVEGIKGSICKDLTKAIENQLGDVEKVEFTGEYYEQTDTTLHTVTGGDLRKAGW